MEEETITFLATPCNGDTPQLFRAVYQFTPAGNGFVRKTLVPGTLVQLTKLAVLDGQKIADDEAIAEVVAANS